MKKKGVGREETKLDGKKRENWKVNRIEGGEVGLTFSGEERRRIGG